jgi:hypothetical protein
MGAPSLFVGSNLAAQIGTTNGVMATFQPAFVETGSRHDQAGPT